ncbi:hypothetical protein BH24ACT12_BH24ACT12_05090 [soil metagenome]
MFGDVNSCLWIYEGAVAGSGATNDSCGAARIMPVSEFTNGQVGGSDIDGATVATVAGPGCTTYDGVHPRPTGSACSRGTSCPGAACRTTCPDYCSRRPQGEP